MLERFDAGRRARAAGLHLLICLAVAAVAATLVFGLWFPGIYRVVAGGRDLFLLISSVDVVLGPLLTFAVFNPKKSRRHLQKDLTVIGVLQLAALVYGLHTVYLARPVAMVFEVDRFRVVPAAQVYLSELPKARQEFRKLPLTGPWLLGTRAPRAGDEHNEAMFMSIEGIERSDRPLFWQPYGESVPDVHSRSRPVSVLLAKYPSRAVEIRAQLQGLDEKAATFVPLVSRGGDWVVILDASGWPVQYVEADGFF